MLRVLAIFSLSIAAAAALFLSGAWLSDSRKGSATGLIVAVFCILAVLALSGCSAVKAVVDACIENKC